MEGFLLFAAEHLGRADTLPAVTVSSLHPCPLSAGKEHSVLIHDAVVVEYLDIVAVERHRDATGQHKPFVVQHWHAVRGFDDQEVESPPAAEKPFHCYIQHVSTLLHLHLVQQLQQYALVTDLVELLQVAQMMALLQAALA